MHDDLLLLYPNRKTFPNRIGQLKNIVELAQAEIRFLREKVKVFEQAQFGQKSEKTKTDPKEKKPKTPCNRNKENYKHNGRNEFPEHLPRQRTEYDLPSEEKFCQACQSNLTKIDEEITKQLDVIPQQFFVHEHVRFKYACRQCGQYVKLAKMPEQPIDKGAIGPGLLAHVITSKYQDGLPLYRIQRQLKRSGIEVSRSTLANWMRYGAMILEPLYKNMKKEIVSGHLANSDDTPMPMLNPGTGKTTTARIWTYGQKEIQTQKAVTVYQFTIGRHGKNPQEVLKDFEGVLQADRYSGYDQLFKPDENGVTKCQLAACWAHVRRKFVNIVKIDLQSIAQEMVMMINDLYAIEKFTHKAEMTDEQRHFYRLEKSEPLLKKIFTWLKKYEPKVTPKSSLGQAINYALRAQIPLQTFLQNGAIEIDNNRAERALKPVVIGRKNWLFAGNENGGKTMAILMSITETCRQNNVNTLEYLMDVFREIPNTLYKDMGKFLPHHWKPPQNISIAA